MKDAEGVALDIDQHFSLGKTKNQLLREARGAISVLLVENKRLADSLAVVEELRPHWAQGYSGDSMAAQSATSALAQIWKVLGAKNQTEAMEALRVLAWSNES